MQAHQLIDQGQTDARALDVRHGFLRRDETDRRVGAIHAPECRAGVANHQFDAVAGLVEAPDDVALEGEFEGVRHKVEDDFLPHLAVDVSRRIDGAGPKRKRQSRTARERTKRADQLLGFGQLGKLERWLHAAGFLDAREIEQRVDELQHSQRVAMRDLEVLALQRMRRAVQRILDGPSSSVSGVRNSWLTLLKKWSSRDRFRPAPRRVAAPPGRRARWRSQSRSDRPSARRSRGIDDRTRGAD